MSSSAPRLPDSSSRSTATKFAEVASGYTTGKDQVLTSYQEIIHSAPAKVQKAERDLLREKNELFAPFPPTIDVNSPTFHSQDFSSVDRSIATFDAKVGAEHRKLIEQHGPTGIVSSDTPIRRRLDG